MRRTIVGLLTAALLLTAGLVAAPRASAEETRCNSTLRARTYDNVVVPSGRTCTISGPKTILGTLQVQTGGTLIASGITINGNLTSQGATRVVFTDGFVGGQVSLDNLTGGFDISRNRVGGAIVVNANRGKSFINGNAVTADIQVYSHRNGIDIYSNRVNGNLQCKSNTVIRGGGNAVQGNKQDQCARF